MCLNEEDLFVYWFVEFKSKFCNYFSVLRPLRNNHTFASASANFENIFAYIRFSLSFCFLISCLQIVIWLRAALFSGSSSCTCGFVKIDFFRHKNGENSRNSGNSRKSGNSRRFSTILEKIDLKQNKKQNNIITFVKSAKAAFGSPNSYKLWPRR